MIRERLGGEIFGKKRALGINYQTCRLRSFYALFIAEVGADWPFLKALQVGDTKCQNCLLPLFLCFPKLKVPKKSASY